MINTTEYKLKIYIMKKVILSLVFLSASSITMFAQTTPQAERAQKVTKERMDEKRGFGRHGGMNVNEKAFEGLNLTDEQKLKIAAIQEANPLAVKAKKADSKDGNKDKKGERKSPEEMKQMREARGAQQQAVRKDYLVQVKEILSPEQYVMFLENFFILQEPGFNGGMMERGGKPVDRGVHRMKDMRSTQAEKKEITTD